ncbi:MAG: hypothetical protein A3H64_00525 [Candidatus Ryanbacteria bacterium RIFCSPLOWO2_02_FULL_45_11c]|uniref:Uncharacterized protein n=1 Tax=Candidatus Ryanbacteria bacterium RIFCSPLOWO2_02_FULL_45_11c TaxID=1802128 RepID=A0A1G2H1H6_9BACT|nr:MAG: hypothetical protein A3H64_00525 [Candidatus Ryanbacteria bacterium RIFCSPLOWO2_02_FULL_45_11c]
MNWDFFDHNFWQTLITLGAIIAAYLIGKKQNEINASIYRTQDVVELYASFALRKNVNEKGEVISQTPLIYVQNVGTRLIYFEKYIFNGKEYPTTNQVLPSTYSQALNDFYWIELPINGEVHACIEVFYYDLEKRKWKSRIFADLESGTWKIKTLSRETAK